MEKESVSVTLKRSLQSSKQCVAKGYHNVADFITKTYTAHKEKGRNETLKMACAKYVLAVLNIGYMVTSLLMIIVGVLGQNLYVNFLMNRHNGDVFRLLPAFWIGTGVILLFVSIFGLIGSFKESNIWTHIFGVLLTIAFLAQISSAIFALQFIGQAQSIAWNGIEREMESYSYGHTAAMDWIQRNFQCCGNDKPTDWNEISKYRKETGSNSGYDYYYRSTTSTTTTSSTPLPDRMPSSCCLDESNYNNLTCDKYYQNGCAIYVREATSATVMIIGSVALAIAALEMIGIAFAFVAARIMRKTKSFFAVQHPQTSGNLPLIIVEKPAASATVETI